MSNQSTGAEAMVRLRAMHGVRHVFGREMTTGRPRSAHLSLPFDVQEVPVPEKEIWADPRFGAYPAMPAHPDV